ncbi:hypothetical protein PVAP13_4KG362500 [Panicum virgatum]|uniref:Uncharacterized protein n=1 Tax=Panicum virgatum TaxID=38727 RepID=A0A8T0TN18_PANVG|nr:hypothetical protein PVAP13_4KG362500 [Panicum virgatum]
MRRALRGRRERGFFPRSPTLAPRPARHRRSLPLSESDRRAVSGGRSCAASGRWSHPRPSASIAAPPPAGPQQVDVARSPVQRPVQLWPPRRAGVSARSSRCSTVDAPCHRAADAPCTSPPLPQVHLRHPYSKLFMAWSAGMNMQFGGCQWLQLIYPCQSSLGSRPSYASFL